MTHVEFVADRIRRADYRERHLPAPLDWHLLQPSEQSRWRHLAEAALDADASWTGPTNQNVIRSG